jgi:hypothetical protein
MAVLTPLWFFLLLLTVVEQNRAQTRKNNPLIQLTPQSNREWTLGQLVSAIREQSGQEVFIDRRLSDRRLFLNTSPIRCEDLIQSICLSYHLKVRMVGSVRHIVPQGSVEPLSNEGKEAYLEEGMKRLINLLHPLIENIDLGEWKQVFAPADFEKRSRRRFRELPSSLQAKIDKSQSSPTSPDSIIEATPGFRITLDTQEIRPVKGQGVSGYKIDEEGNKVPLKMMMMYKNPFIVW